MNQYKDFVYLNPTSESDIQQIRTCRKHLLGTYRYSILSKKLAGAVPTFRGRFYVDAIDSKYLEVFGEILQSFENNSVDTSLLDKVCSLGNLGRTRLYLVPISEKENVGEVWMCENQNPPRLYIVKDLTRLTVTSQTNSNRGHKMR
jgi:hypothetical protein